MMEDGESKEQPPMREQNPLLKRKPLNLGASFHALGQRAAETTFDPLNGACITVLLFGAEWCVVTKGFVPRMKQFYDQVNLENKKLEVIFISIDRTKAQYERFAKTMPWLGIQFGDARIPDLREFYGIKSVPTLLLIDKRGEIVPVDCRAQVFAADEDATLEGWQRCKSVQQEVYEQQSTLNIN